MNKSADSKLFKFKKCLTLSEAAKHLSVICDKEVTEPDILQFALDGHLTLSVDFVNPTTAMPVSKMKVIPGSFLLAASFDEVIMKIWGLWDLFMHGGMELYIEREFRRQMGHPKPESSGVRYDLGLYVEGQNGQIYAIRKKCDPSEYAKYGLEEPKEVVSNDDLNEHIEKMNQLHEKWKSLCQKNVSISPDDIRLYLPVRSLPQDSILVVRTEALIKFEEHLNDHEIKAEIEHDYLSGGLKLLIDAAERFWKNADLKDRDTQPTNEKVSAWLVEKGFSKAMANAGATIIRPKGAGTGRKPD